MNVRLPLDLYSPDQVGIIKLELGNHMSQLRDASVRAKVTHKETAKGKPHFSALLQNVLFESGIADDDQGSLELLSQSLETIRDKAPVVHIMLTALPNLTLKRQLIEWFRKEVNPYTLVTFSVRADMGGGMILQAGSHIYDLSFRQQILSHKQRIAEILHNV